MLKFSIITPSFNQAAYLEETIQSVIKQDYPALDWIVIDGGSTDGSVEILKKYEKYFSYWVSEKDSGQSNAINKGFARASGDVLTWLNSDDLLTEGTLHKVNAIFEEHQNVDLVFGATILFGENFTERIFKPAADHFEARAIGGLPFPQPSSFFRASCYKSFGPLSEQLHFGMDYDYFMKIFLNRDFIRTEEIFSRYRYHANSKSVAQNAKFAQDYAFIFSKLLNSVGNGKNWQNWLKERNLWVEIGDESVFCEKTLSDDFIREAHFFNLYNRLIFLYEALETKQVHHLCNVMRELNPELYEDFEELAQIRERTKWLPSSVIKFLRKIKR